MLGGLGLAARTATARPSTATMNGQVTDSEEHFLLDSIELGGHLIRVRAVGGVLG
jgi:hypothetical protein